MSVHQEASLRVSVAQYSDKGKKDSNEDALGCVVPAEPELSIKGLVALIADGVSSAEAGKEASETCVRNFLGDYFSTPDTWSVKTSAQKILTALNRWLYGQGLSYIAAERGYISTLSVLVIKSRSAHLFHIGDSRIYRLRAGDLEQLTHDHNARISRDKTYLTRAMGMDITLDVDYYSCDVEEGDVFLLSTDGVHEFLPRTRISELLLQSRSLDECCERLVSEALAAGSDDNLSCQVVRVDTLPSANADDAQLRQSELPFPPVLSEGMILDGYRVLQALHASARSQVYLVEDVETLERLAMKTPSPNYEEDQGYREHFVLESWMAQRIDSPHVVRVRDPARAPRFLFCLTEYVEGLPLSDWMQANPKPTVERVLNIVEQLVKGVRALHRRETLHQDLRPDNIIIGADDHVTLIDFGSCHVAGVAEMARPYAAEPGWATETYSAPEYRLRQRGSVKTELFSIAVIVYEMLTGRLPYGERYENTRSANDFYRLRYQPAPQFNPMVPVWMDGALKKALQISPELRYEALSEFVWDLAHPNPAFLDKSLVPLVQRNPLRFWQCTSAVLGLLQLFTLWLLLR